MSPIRGLAGAHRPAALGDRSAAGVCAVANGQIDWIGAEPTIQPGFIGPKRRRQAVHDEKAELRAQLKALTETPPRELGSAGIVATRRWVALQKAGVKTLNSERASVQQLRSAISGLEGRAWAEA
jgi:hypothetical protein